MVVVEDFLGNLANLGLGEVKERGGFVSIENALIMPVPERF